MTEELPEPLRVPHPQRLDPHHPRYTEILARHEAALEAAAPGYLDPDSGFMVLTAGFLWDRGFCCENGCRHCPWIDREARRRAQSPPGS